MANKFGKKDAKDQSEAEQRRMAKENVDARNARQRAREAREKAERDAANAEKVQHSRVRRGSG
jgi:hypothetical protein